LHNTIVSSIPLLKTAPSSWQRSNSDHRRLWSMSDDSTRFIYAYTRACRSCSSIEACEWWHMMYRTVEITSYSSPAVDWKFVFRSGKREIARNLLPYQFSARRGHAIRNTHYIYYFDSLVTFFLYIHIHKYIYIFILYVKIIFI